jgi:hypothetical protein
MNYLLFGLEISLSMAAIGLVPARSELRIARSRVIYNEPAQAPRSQRHRRSRCANRHGIVT